MEEEGVDEGVYFVRGEGEDEFEILERRVEGGEWFGFGGGMIKGKMRNVD